MVVGLPQLRYLCPQWGRLTISISLLNLEMIRPIGVESKKRMGEPRTPFKARLNKRKEARRPAKLMVYDAPKVRRAWATPKEA
jgi:hypothetical protein